MSHRTSIVEERYSQWAPLLMRLVMGYGFILHGWVKVSRGPARFEVLLTQLGVPLPQLMSWVVPFVEILGGIAVLAGAFTAIAAVPLIATMLTAMFSVHLRHGFSSVNTIGLTADGPVFGPPGYEINLVYIAGLLSLALGGAGAFSIDSLMAHRRVSRARTLASTGTSAGGKSSSWSSGASAQRTAATSSGAGAGEPSTSDAS